MALSTNLIYPARFHPLAGTALSVSKENRVLAEVRESGLVIAVLPYSLGYADAFRFRCCAAAAITGSEDPLFLLKLRNRKAIRVGLDTKSQKALSGRIQSPPEPFEAKDRGHSKE